jgi:NAD(P)-dependent dehydrogenase (short-subunit alcohol dehydrogenase family)
MAGRLEGRRVLVVGAGQQDLGIEDPPIGNGRAMSVAFAREGAALALADIDEAAAQTTARLVEAEGAQAVVITGDASDEAAVAEMFARTGAELGGIDVVVLIVGIGAGIGLRQTTVADWDRVMAVNLRSAFLGCRLGLESLGPGGAILMMGSIASRETMPLPAYSASKAALTALCQNAAVEGAPDVRVNVLEPGLIDTSLGRLASKLNPARDKVRIPLRRQGTAWEVAAAATFLVSDEASYVTGQTLIVDGGLTVAMRT